MNAENGQTVGGESPEHALSPEAQVVETASQDQTPEAGVHEVLLEGVSTDAIVASGAAENEPEGPSPEAEPNPGGADHVPLAEDLTVVQDIAAQPLAAAAETVEAASAVAESVARSLPEQGPLEQIPLEHTGEILPAMTSAPAITTAAAVAVPDLRRVMDFAKSPRLAEAMGELGEVNATVLSYLRGEGSAALAHWQALSGARTPADAIRIQVDEIQRAADASLSCFAAIAKRAGRFTAVFGRP